MMFKTLNFLFFFTLKKIDVSAPFSVPAKITNLSPTLTFYKLIKYVNNSIHTFVPCEKLLKILLTSPPIISVRSVKLYEYFTSLPLEVY